MPQRVKCERCSEKRINLLGVHPKRICHSTLQLPQQQQQQYAHAVRALNPIIIGFYDNRQPYALGLHTNIKLELWIMNKFLGFSTTKFIFKLKPYFAE